METNNYNTITGLNGGRGPYSEQVKKEVCLNHISKRLGTCLGKLKGMSVAKEAASSERMRLQSTMMLTEAYWCHGQSLWDQYSFRGT